MKKFHYAGFAISILVLFAWNGLAQSSTITGTITTYAGPPLPVSGAKATTQAIDSPSDPIPDGAGGFYFVSLAQNRLYRVHAEGTLQVIAGTGTSGFKGDGGPASSAALSLPTGVALDGAGNLFIADLGNNRVRKVTQAGIISTIAGTGTPGSDGDGGPATSARLNPFGVAVDGAGNLFIADLDNNRIRKVNPAGIISTVAGTGTRGFGGDGGPAASAQLTGPKDITLDGAGNLFIADTFNDRIRKVTPAGIITTIAGAGTHGFSGDGGPATASELAWPSAVAVDGAGNLFIADSSNARIRKITPAGIITSVGGVGAQGPDAPGDPAVFVQFSPSSVSVDAAGNLFIGEPDNGRIRKVTPDGFINTVAGNGRSRGFGGDGGPATSSRLNEPWGVALDAAGNLFIADTENNRIRKVSPSGIITTVADGGINPAEGDEGPVTSTQLFRPHAVAVDAAGNLFIADSFNNRVLKVTASGIFAAGVISAFAGDGISGFGGDGGPAISAQLSQPSGIALDAAGNLYIADSGNHRVRKVTPNGVITTVAGTGTEGFGGDGGPAIAARLKNPGNVVVDRAGNLFIADAGNNRVRQVTPTGIISTIAGTGTEGFNGDGGSATSAQLSLSTAAPYLFSTGLAMDAAGNLYIGDTGNHRIRKVSPAGTITTVAGTGIRGFSEDGGPASSAQLFNPSGIAVDGKGDFFVADTFNSRIRKVSFTTQTTFSIVDHGGVSLRSLGTSPVTAVGYASIQPNGGSTTPAALAILGFRQNNVLVSETGVPASPLIQSGRIYAEVNGAVNTGVAIANPNGQPAVVSFSFTGTNGNFGSGTTIIPANGQIAKFLNEPPFNSPSSLSGTFTFTSSSPVSVVALRGLTNERSEFLITTLPVVDLTTPATTSTIVFPYFADGGGWTTQIVLVNPTDLVLTGTVQFVDRSGEPAAIAGNNQLNTSFVYSIRARSSQRLQTSGAGAMVVTGSVRAIPAANTPAPSGLAIFSFRNDGTTVAEAGVPAMRAGSTFRLFAESSGAIQTAVAVANTSANAATVTLDLTKLDGSATGLTGVLSVPPNGQTAVFLNQIEGFGSLQTSFEGVLRLSSASSIAVTGLRTRYNERNDFLFTTTPAVDEASAASRFALFLPHLADSGGYTMQFILFSAQPGSHSSGMVQFFSQNGGALNLTLQ